MTIYEIKKRTKETAPYFFNRETMRFFGQRLSDFTVKKQSDGRYKITCPSGENWDGNYQTVRYFNPKNNVLEQRGHLQRLSRVSK